MKKIWLLYNHDAESWENEKLIETAKRNDLEAILLKPKNFDIITSGESTRSIRYESKNIDLPNAVLVRTGAGTNYFTAALLRQIEKFHIPVINDPDSILRVKDKLHATQILAKSHLPIPKTMLVSFPVDSDLVEQEIGFPCVVKLVSGSKGNGVYLCENKKFFKQLMELLENLKSKKTILIQEYVNKQVGTDLRVWVVGGKVVAAMKRHAPDGDFRANISRGGTGEPWEITEEIDYIARESARVLGLEIAGIDLLFDEQGFKVCEANSSPGFSGIDWYCKTDMAQKIIDYLKFKI
jgi:gamma-F420-2:alpha-L-glutamate ligase